MCNETLRYFESLPHAKKVVTSAKLQTLVNSVK